MVGNSVLVQHKCFLSQSSPTMGWNASEFSPSPITEAFHTRAGQLPGEDTTIGTPTLLWHQECSSKCPQSTIRIVAEPSTFSDFSVFKLVLHFNKFRELPGSLPKGPLCTISISLTGVLREAKTEPGRERWSWPGFGPWLNHLLCSGGYQTSLCFGFLMYYALNRMILKQKCF